MLIILANHLFIYKIFFNFVFMNPILAWLKRDDGGYEVLKVLPSYDEPVTAYYLVIAHEIPEIEMGRILFDIAGYWIYDGDDLTINEQEQIAAFIQQHDLTQRSTLHQ